MTTLAACVHDVICDAHAQTVSNEDPRTLSNLDQLASATRQYAEATHVTLNMASIEAAVTFLRITAERLTVTPDRDPVHVVAEMIQVCSLLYVAESRTTEACGAA